MGLDQTCTGYLHALLAVKPVYGWGWSRLDDPDKPVDYEVNGAPTPFHGRVRDFFSYRGELRGVVGRIEQTGHIYDGFWVVVSTRVTGIYNFTDNIPYCDIQIGPNRPVGSWPGFKSGAPIVGGYGFIGESHQRIQEYEAMRIKRWEESAHDKKRHLTADAPDANRAE